MCIVFVCEGEFCEYVDRVCVHAINLAISLRSPPPPPLFFSGTYIHATWYKYNLITEYVTHEVLGHGEYERRIGADMN